MVVRQEIRNRCTVPGLWGCGGKEKEFVNHQSDLEREAEEQ